MMSPGTVRPYEVIEQKPLNNWSLDECVAYAPEIKARMSFWHQSTYFHDKCTIHVTPVPAASITIIDLANRILFQDPPQSSEDSFLIFLQENPTNSALDLVNLSIQDGNSLSLVADLSTEHGGSTPQIEDNFPEFFKDPYTLFQWLSKELEALKRSRKKKS